MKSSDGIDNTVITDTRGIGHDTHKGMKLRIEHSQGTDYSFIQSIDSHTTMTIRKWKWYDAIVCFLYYRVYWPIRKLFPDDER